MLFQMSFLRGFLQSHFIKQKAWSELLQVAFVIGTCTRSTSEVSWWVQSWTQEEGNTLLAFISQYTLTYISESSTNYQEHALLGKGNCSSWSVLEQEIDGMHSSPVHFLGVQTDEGDNLNDRVKAIKQMLASQPFRQPLRSLKNACVCLSIFNTLLFYPILHLFTKSNRGSQQTISCTGPLFSL